MRVANITLTAVGLVLGTVAPVARASGPLVDFETGESLVTNVKAFRVGDLVTIIITENATANATSKTKANNKSEHTGGPGLGRPGLHQALGPDDGEQVQRRRLDPAGRLAAGRDHRTHRRGPPQRRLPGRGLAHGQHQR